MALTQNPASKQTKQDQRDPYVLPPRRGGMPRPQLTEPEQRPWALTTEGACAELAPDVLRLDPFDVDDSDQDPARAAVARSICAGCPVQRRCRDYAMANEPYGFWGGLDAKQRRLLRGGPLASFEERAASAKIRAWFAQGLTADQVAQRLSVTRRTIERWRDDAGLVQRRGCEDGAAGRGDAAA